MAILSIDLQSHVRDAMDQMASKAGISSEELAAILLQSFVENDGKIYTGAWPEGPGIRLLPDWPRFSSGVVKVKKTG